VNYLQEGTKVGKNGEKPYLYAGEPDVQGKPKKVRTQEEIDNHDLYKTAIEMNNQLYKESNPTKPIDTPMVDNKIGTGTGDIVESELYRRVKEQDPLIFQDDATRNKYDLDVSRQIAVNLVEGNTQKAQEIYDTKTPITGMTNAHLGLALGNKHILDGNWNKADSVMYNLSQSLSEQGANIVSVRGSVGDTSVFNYVQQVVKNNTANIAKTKASMKGTPTEKVSEIIKNESKELSNFMKERKLTIEEINKFLDDWTCK
jgi:hypothetical protein